MSDINYITYVHSSTFKSEKPLKLNSEHNPLLHIHSVFVKFLKIVPNETYRQNF